MRFHRGLNREFTNHRFLFFFAIACTAAASVATLIQCYGLSASLYSVIFNKANHLSFVLFVLVAAVIARSIFEYIRNRIADHIAAESSQRLRANIASHTFALRSHFPATLHSSELSALSSSGIDATEPYLRSFYPAFLTATITPFAVVAVVLYLDVLSGFVLLLTGPLIPVFAMLIGSHAARKAETQWFSLGDLARRFHDLLRGWSTLQLHRAASRAHSALEASGERYKQSTLSVLRTAFLSSFSLEFIATVSTAVIAVEIGLRLLYGKIEYPEAIFILIAAPEFFTPLRNLGAAFHSSVAGIDAIKRIDSFLAIIPPKSMSNASCHPNKSTCTEFPIAWNEISINNIAVKYPDSPSDVLNNFSATFKRGEIIGITGASGIGKSTLVAALQRNLEPHLGSITVNGISASEISLESWKNQFLFLPQRPNIANATIRENILLGRESPSELDLTNACELAHLTAIIQHLPNGKDSILGENGTTLSSGQAHRVALARAFLSSAPIIIFDEPTAHLDANTEAVISSSMQLFAKSRTVIVITHRKETLEVCHRTIEITPFVQEAMQ